MRLNYGLRRLSGDTFGGVTTAATVLPMALAYGVATGMGAIAGMYGAIVVGFCTAVFGGTPARISYTAAAMAVAMMVVLNEHADSVSEALTIVALAGIIQIALGVLRIGRFITYTPYSMIAGFTSGIGVIIIIIQTLPFLGAGPASGGLFGIFRAWPEAVIGANLHAVAIGAVSLAICVLWPRQLGRFVPGPLPALVVGTLIAAFWLQDAPVIGALPQGLPSLHVPEVSADLLTAVQPALTLALIGSVNSLVASLVADSLTRTRHKSNQELVGQGIGNVAAGLLGALPGAGATSGTTVNIRAGGNSPISGVICAGALFALVLGLGRIAEPIPLAALSGVLIKAGWDIIDWRLIKRVRHVRRDYLLVMLLTLLLTVFVDLITAIVLGLIVAAFARARESERRELGSVISVPLLDSEFFSDGPADADNGDRFQARVGLVDLRGQFSFASASQLAWLVGADIEQHEVVIFDFSNTTDMDDSAALVMERLIDAAMGTNTECIVLNLSGPVSDNLRSLNVFRRVPEERFVDNLDAARELAGDLLNSGRPIVPDTQ